VEPISAWVRPVSTLSALTIDAVRYVRPSHPFREPPPEFYPTSISLAFSDGTSTAIEVKTPFDEAAKRERWERFFATARGAIER
jgi:hypothetical protein